MDKRVNRSSPPPPSHGPFHTPEPDPGSYYAPPAAPVGFYPLDLNRIWSLTFSLFRFRFTTFAAIALAVLVPVALVTALFAAYSTGLATSWSQEIVQRALNGDASVGSVFAGYPWATVGLSWLLTILAGVFSYVAVAALTVAVLNTFSGARASARDSLQAALRMLGRLVLLYIVIFGAVFLFILLGALLFVFALVAGLLQSGLIAFLLLIAFVGFLVLFIHVVMRLQLSLPVLVVEGTRATDSVRRSWQLTRGSLWRIAGYLVLFGIVAIIPGVIVAAILNLFLGPHITPGTLTFTFNPAGVFISSLISAIVAALFTPITTIALTLLYLDIRFRHGEQVPIPREATAS